MESVRGCYESACRKLSACTGPCTSCNCHCQNDIDGNERRESQSEENDNELTISTQYIGTIPTAFENESQPLLGQGDVRKRTANDDEKESSGCFPVFPCLRRRWRKRGRKLQSNQSSARMATEDVEKCSSTDRQLGLEEKEEPRPLLRKEPSRLEMKQSMIKELHCLKDKLKYHFTSPFHKYKHHKRKPWKVIILFIKIVLATGQLVLFSQSSFRDAQFFANNIKAFHHLFIRDYESGAAMELYTREDVFDQLAFTVERYFVINETAIGSYDFASAVNSDVPPPVTVCYTAYKQGLINSFNWTYKFDPESVTNCSLKISHNESQSTLISLLKQYFGRAPFDRINTVSLKFAVRTVFLNAFHFPDCRQFDIVVSIDNSEHNGVAHVRVTGDMESFLCNGEIVKTMGRSKFIAYTSIDIVVAIVSVISITLCIRSLIQTYHLAQLAADFFRKYCRRPLKIAEMMGLVNLWFICTMAADILLIVGSVGKILISQKLDTVYLTWSMLLGIGTGLVWTSLLRFLGYFQKYNILLVTMKAAMPSILRFMLCTLILYVAFLLCGWAVLGPYNEKFKNIETTSECLFSLLNGDDMFNTFKLTTSTNQPAVIFCQIYLYVFVALFIYIVLNLFIGLISEMYAAVRMMGKKQWKALYLGKLYHLLDEDEDDDWDDDIIDWNRDIQRGRFNSCSSDRSSDEQERNDQQTIREFMNISEVM